MACCRAALTPLERAGDRYGTAATWDSLGFAYHQLQVHHEAVACYRRAIDLHRVNGDRHSEAGGLQRLAEVYLTTDDTPEAAACWRRAVEILEELDDRGAAQLRARLADFTGPAR